MKRHQWTDKDEVIAFFLYRYGDDDLMFKRCGIAKKLGMSKESLVAKEGNFKFLDTGKGLSNASCLSKKIYEKYKNKPKDKHRIEIENLMYPQK